MAASIAGAFTVGDITEEQFRDQIDKLRNYLGGEQSGETFASPNATAAAMTGILGR